MNIPYSFHHNYKDSKQAPYKYPTRQNITVKDYNYKIY